MSCPRCKSDDWKLASFVHKSGLSSISATSTSVGVGAGAETGGVGLGVGVGSTRTTGLSQTELSALSAPPQEPKNSSGLVYWGITIGLALTIGGKSELIGWLVLFGAILLWTKIKPALAEEYEDQISTYQDALAKWEVTRVCQRCGTFYIQPEELAAVQHVQEG